LVDIPPFWSGARAHARGPELALLADRVGPSRLERATSLDLRAVGVPEPRARAWLASPGSTTVGEPIVWSDPRYPERLRAASDPPAVLCVQGDPACLVGAAVAVVGTRECTAYGVAVARHLARALARRGVTVVSGLARGIDTHAHRAAVDAGRTVAVLGHGLGSMAPPSNAPLRDRIARDGGLIVSAFPDDLAPARWTFPERNKWIAALSDATVVVEAPERSGALLTAAEAAAIGRDVYAVPAALGAAASAGCLQLLADGAGVVHDIESFAERFGVVQGELLDPLLLALADGPTAEQLASRLGLPVPTVLARLSALEVQRRVVRLPGFRFGRG
jgi:DNA processing protein